MTLTVEQIETTYPAPASDRNFYPILAYWIPIERLEEVRAAYRDAGTTIRVRYRGPRTVSIGRTMTYGTHTYTRSRHRAMQDCLKSDATHFTVYNYGA